MLDLKFVRENLDLVQQNLDNRHTKGDLDNLCMPRMMNVVN